MNVPAEIDVIILSWNRAEDTIAAVQSAAAQVGIVQHILIVDQGSEPDVVAKLEAFLRNVPRTRLMKLERNVGVAQGRNLAVSMGQSPYIVALDSDAEFADDRELERVAAILDANLRLCAIGFRIVNYFNGEIDWTSWDYPPGSRPHTTFASTRFIGAGHAIRRHVFEEVGGYDAQLFFCGEELDLCYRMLNTGHRIAYMPEVVVRHKVSPEHRVFWDKGRFYFTVRNNLYTGYKFGTASLRIVLSAAAFFVKGCRNHTTFEVLRAFKDCVRMCWQFHKSDQDRRYYRFSNDTWRYILQCERNRQDSVIMKIRRQLALLPHHG